MRDVTPHTARHDDVNSAQHEIDKAEKAIRSMTEYKAVPALAAEAGAKIIDGFKGYSKGWSWKLVDGKPVVVDNKEYTKTLIKLARERSQYKRVRIRGDKQSIESGAYKSGAVSLVTTVAPWAVSCISKLPENKQNELFLKLAQVRAKTVERVSGRTVYGGGLHLDTAVPHFHDHIFKTTEDGKIHPKSKFKTAGPWLVGAHRINQKFPNLLSKQKKEMLTKALARKDMDHLIDIKVSADIDKAVEDFFIDEGIYIKYEDSCREYTKRKRKSQEEEQYKPLMKASLESFNETGIWPIFYKFMKLCMWRMIPKSLRKPIQMSIRLFQLIKKDDDSNGDGTFDTAGDGTLEMPSLSNKVRKILLANIELSRELGAKKQKLPGNIG
jgi:hypothetical protein